MSTDSPGPAIPILQTKLHRPRVAPDVVRRDPVLARLDAGRHLPLTLVSAPAGYGKSSLISEWLESRDEAWAWLSLDEAEGDLRQFLEYLVAGVRSRFPRACAATLALLEAPDLPPVPVIARGLANGLDALEAPVLFALDDYHHIDPTSAVHELIGLLLRHPPPPFHLVILTRRDPPLPLSGLRARGMLTEVRQLELRLTRAECGASDSARPSGQNHAAVPELGRQRPLCRTRRRRSAVLAA